MNTYYKINANKSNTKQNNKPFCLVCKNAGKTEKEYTSHYTKSSKEKNAVILCPTILNNICTYCKNKGHFKSNCSVLLEKEKEKEKEKAYKEYQEKKQTVTQSTQKPKNMFELLASDHTKSIQKTKITKEDLFPALVKPAAASTKKNKKESETIVAPTLPLSYSNITTQYIPPPKEVSAQEKKEKIFRIKNVGLQNIHHDWSDDNYWSDEEFDEYEDLHYMGDSASITSNETDHDSAGYGSFVKSNSFDKPSEFLGFDKPSAPQNLQNKYTSPRHLYSLVLPPDYIEDENNNTSWW